MNDWIDLPIISAIDYFQNILGYFINFARTYGSFFGLIGLVWTGIRLVNSRIDLRSAWWDSLSKWFVFLLLINFYAAGTSFISKISNEIGLHAGKGKTTIVNSLTSLKNRIEAETKLYDRWVNGLTDLIKEELGISLPYWDETGEDIESYEKDLLEVVDLVKFSSNKQKKDFDALIKAYKDTKPDIDGSIWGQQTLEALNSVLMVTSADGSVKTDLTGVYITENPELNIWLKDSEGKATNYFSSSAIARIGVLTAQIIWEKTSMDVTQQLDSDGNIEYRIKKGKFQIKRLPEYIMAGISCACIIFSVIFFLLQYVMCILEFTIVQGIGAAFIPFYLFDGTKDIPKKLLPVFTGFAIKILVMVICLMFVINMYLSFAAEQISPTSGSMGFPAFTECLFICMLSFVLTSNAPKIAMTLLTGQPQLSMGEFVQAAAAFGAGAMATKNLASTVASPAMALAKRKAHEWGEQRGAASSARVKQENSMKTQFAEQRGIDTTTRSGRKELKNQWNEYKNSEAGSQVRNDLKSVGNAAKEDVKLRQQVENKKNGGIVGEAGRMLAHYGGALANPKQTLMQGRQYHTPMSNIDIDKIGAEHQPNNEYNFLNVDTNKEPVKNDVKQDEIKGIGGERQVE